MIRGEFVPGGAGDTIDLGGFMYNITAEDPMGQEVVNLNKHVTPTIQQPTQTFTFIQAQGVQSGGSNHGPMILNQSHASNLNQNVIGIPVSLAASGISGNISGHVSSPVPKKQIPRNQWHQKTQVSANQNHGKKQPIKIIRKYGNIFCNKLFFELF